MANVTRTMLKLLVSSLVTVAAGLALAAAANAGCGQEYRSAPARTTVAGGPPLAIGDSVLADAVPTLVRYGFEADGMVCRQMSQGISILRERGTALPHLVVLALGANGPVTSGEIDEALALLGPTRVLALVTPHGGVSPSAPAAMRTAAAANPRRIILLDWDRLAGEHSDWLAPDGVHLGGPAGIEGFAALIAGALPYATSTAVTPTPKLESEETANTEPGTPRTLAPPTRAAHRTRRPVTDRRATPKSTRPHDAGAHGRTARSRATAATATHSPRRVPAPHEATLAAHTTSSEPRAPEGPDETEGALTAVGAAAVVALAGLLWTRARRRRRVGG